jgi:peroxiredoxin
MKLRILLAVLLLSTFSAFSQAKKEVFKLKIKAKGLENKYCLLANHMGSNKYKIDSLPFDKKGETTYVDNEDKIKGGIYMIVFPTMGNNYVEFLVSKKEMNMELLFDSININKVQIKNSVENDFFYSEIKFVEPLYKEMNDLKGKFTAANTSESDKKKIEERMKEMDKMIQDKRDGVIKTNPTLLYSKIMKMMKEIDVPDAPKKADGTLIDSNFQYNYYKSHYWDNIDLNDDRLLYTPVFEGKFKTFFDKIVLKHPDTLKVEIDLFLGKIKDPNSMMNRYCLGTLINDFANSKIMGQDALYVHLVRNYYQKGRAPWTDSATIQKMKYDADDIEPLLIGKVAPDFAAFDTTLVKSSRLYDMKSEYKVLVFWNPDCGHCKKEIPKLDSVYPDLLKRKTDVFAVSTITDKGNNIEDWKNFIKNNKLRFKNYADPKFQMNPLFLVLYHIKATPEYFILDKNNKIIAKKLAPEQMPGFIDNYNKTLK